jgi:hypothetical protein
MFLLFLGEPKAICGEQRREWLKVAWVLIAGNCIVKVTARGPALFRKGLC